jgi:hypothetical protein
MFAFAITASGPLSDSGLNQGRRGIFVPNQKQEAGYWNRSLPRLEQNWGGGAL